MISEADALRRILAHAVPIAIERVSLGLSLGRYLAADVFATIPNPRFDVSSMDGYAIRSASCGSLLRVEGEQPAGLDRGLALGLGGAIRVFTGAPIPAGADAVIMQEDVSIVVENDEVLLRCVEPVEVGENIRRMGADVCKGQCLMRKGDELTPSRLALLASQGIDAVDVHPKPRVAVLTTGDELVEPGSQSEKGQIFNSNGTLLQALLNEEGIHAVTLAHCGDGFDETRQTLESLVAHHDVVIIVGGVSVGDHDQVKPALKAVGILPEIWRVKVKPGKPFLFAHRPTPSALRVFGLPGNPVSAFVTFHLFVKPALKHWMGAREVTGRSSLAEVAQNLHNPGDRPHYVRGTLEGTRFVPVGLQQSHAIGGLGGSNVLLRLEEGESLKAGSLRSVLWV